jgi:hypothetical protein
MEWNLFFAVAAPIALIFGINWMLQRGTYQRAPLVMPTDAARNWLAAEKREMGAEAVNDAEDRIAA